MEKLKKNQPTRKQALDGDAGYRSPCLSHAKRALYHLSYTPCKNKVIYCLIIQILIVMDL